MDLVGWRPTTMRRLAGLCAQLSQPPLAGADDAPDMLPGGRAAGVGAGVHVQMEPNSASTTGARVGDDPNRGLKLLTDRQLKDFLVNGVTILQIDDMPREWHQSFYAKALEMSRSGAGRGSLWSQMPEITQVCRTPTVRGALTSILGRDYVMHPHRALHTSGSGDQGFHKDGNHVPVRDHYPRWLMCMYYPTDTTLEMGPTCVVPGSHYYEVDRLQWGTLYTDCEMPQTNLNGEQDAWKAKVAASGRILQGSDAEARTELLEKAGRFFKSTTSNGQPSGHMACTCPAGSFALIHFDILDKKFGFSPRRHRGSRQFFETCGAPDEPLPETVKARQREEVPWRPMFKLQYFRTSAPQELLVTEREDVGAPFAYTNAPSGEQAIWSSAYRWLQGGVSPQRVPEATPTELVSLIENSSDEVQRMGAGYQLGEHVAAASTASESATVLTLMKKSLQNANTPIDPDSLPGGAEVRGQHGCKEGVLRALQYGLMNSGPAAVPTLFDIIESADLSSGPGANVAKRALHALGEAERAPTPETVSRVGKVVQATRDSIDAYLQHLAAGGTTFPELFDPALEVDKDDNTLQRLRGFGGAGVIQQEPSDMYGAELHYLAATAQQCLGALAESAVVNNDTATCAACAAEFAKAIKQPEDGWMFEARQGCAARECAAQGLVKLASTGAAQPSGTLVNPAGNTGQTAAVFVPAFVEEARRRVRNAKGGTVATQEATLAVVDQLLSPSASDALDAGLASWSEGEQLYQTDEVVNEAGW